MSTTRAFEIPASAKAANIKRRFTAASEQPKGAPTPAVKDDLVHRIGTDQRHDISDGLPLIIDVFPDFRWILMSIMYYSNLFYSSIDVKNRSKTSPMTLAVYFLTIVHAHILASDLFIRNTPSYYANQFMNDSSRREYLEFLLSLPVPDILMKFLETLTATNDPRRPRVQFCPSAAGFSYYHDFGRFFPPSIFLQAHTTAATVSSRSDTDSALNALLAKIAYDNFSIGQLFGQLLATTSNVLNYDSKLFQSFLALFNPIVERSLQRRNTFSPTPITPYTSSTHARFNPYICMLHATALDITEMTTVLESVSHALSNILSFKGQLGTLYDNLSGIDILRHGYSSYALPTWHAGTTSPPTASLPLLHQNASQRARTLRFMQPIHERTNGTSLRFPADKTTINQILYLVKDITKSTNFPNPDTDYRMFSPRYDVSPRLRILDPYDVNTSTLSSVVYSGLIIESLEIDGSIVLQPDADNTLDECNSQVLQSAVPVQLIRRATLFTGSTTTSPVHCVQRVQHTHASQKASISLYDAGESRLGVFDKSVDEPVPAALPAFRIREHTSWFSRMFNIIAYKTTSPDASTDDTDTRVPNGHFTLWSPYRYVSQTWIPSRQSMSLYMLVNMRTNYGMNAPLSEIAHPNDLLPIN
jgi:hypothetical protein